MVEQNFFLPNFERAQLFTGTQSADGDKYYHFKMFIKAIVFAYYLVGIILFAVSILLDPKATFYDYVEAIFPLMCLLLLLFNFSVTVATRHKIKNLFTRVGNFDEFGPPTHLENVRKHLDAFMGFLFIYITAGPTVVSIQILADFESCGQLNKLQGRDVICGFATSLDYMLYDIKTGYLWCIHLILQFYCLVALCFGGAIVSCGILASAELTVVRIQHLEELLLHCINSDYDDETKKRKLNNCIRYHQEIINIVDEINHTHTIIATPLLINYSLVIGLQLLSLLMKVTFRTGANCFGWIATTFVVCIGAERLIEKSSDLATCIYSTEWYNLNLSMRKDIGLMIMRSQTPLAIKAGPLGDISLATFASLMKGAYTYGTMKGRFGQY